MKTKRCSRLFGCAVAALGIAISVNVQLRAASIPLAGTEPDLLNTLRSGKPEEKASACKHLAIKGSREAVPELAKLLPDEQLSSWARIALEAIPDPSADEALIDATKKLDGRLLVGMINSLGVRRPTAAVGVLVDRLKANDAEVASAAAVALGHIGNADSIKALEAALASAKPPVQSAVAEGCVLAAERSLADGKRDVAVELYDRVRKADVPKQRILEATRGAIVARGTSGVPLLVEQLRSPDRKLFEIGLSTAREMKDNAVGEALVRELDSAKPERAALIVVALGDRGEAKLPAAVVKAASTGDKQVRLAALSVIGQLGDASTISPLLETAANDDAELATAAKAALAGLNDANINAELSKRLAAAKGKSLVALIEVIGQRRADAAAELVKVLDSSDADVRKAALTALGATAGPADVPVLIEQVGKAKQQTDAELAERALKTACIRMPDREATAAQLAAVMSNASPQTKACVVRVLGAMGGQKSLSTIAAAMKTGDADLQDVGTRVLGEWMTPDAAPVLLEITKGSAPDKFRVRALRGYLRIARQQKLADADRLEMCKQALAVAQRDEERALVLDALKRCPSPESVELASSMLSDKELRDRAVETAIFIGEKIKDKNPAAAKAAGEKALATQPKGKLAERAKALTKSP